MSYLVVRLDDPRRPLGPATVEAVFDHYPSMVEEFFCADDPYMAIWQDDAVVPIRVGDRVFQGTMAVMKIRDAQDAEKGNGQ